MKERIPRAEFSGLIDHPGSGAVLGTKGQRVLLVRLQRHDFPFETYEIPGGVCEPNETHEQAAHREFLEETGYTIGYAHHLLTLSPSVGYSNEYISVFMAEVLDKQGAPEHDCCWFDKAEVRHLIDKGQIIDAQSLAALSIWLGQEETLSLPQVLFLCTGNYYRSRFCEIYFNHLTTGLGLKADSKGLLAYRKINEGMLSVHTQSYLHQINLSPGKMKFPEQIEHRHFSSGVRIIAMDEVEHRPMMEQFFPEFSDRIEYWQVHDIDFTEPDDALPVLKERVENLLKEF